MNQNLKKYLDGHRQLYEEADKEVRGDSLLDLGCGPGFFILEVLKARPWIKGIGIDSSPYQVETARRHLEAFPDFQILQADIFDYLKRFERKFDTISCMEVLEHTEIKNGFARDLIKNLNPGGRIIITVPDSRTFDHGIVSWSEEKVNGLYQGIRGELIIKSLFNKIIVSVFTPETREDV